MRSRFAPSPTGDLHLGSVAVAVVARLLADEVRLRIEDIDAPRVVPGAAARQQDDLAWLGIGFDGDPWFQSARTSVYKGALARLEAAGKTYRCDCSRSEIAREASAPHAGEELRYPGTCFALREQARVWKRPPAIRLSVDGSAEGGTSHRVDGSAEGGTSHRVDPAATETWTDLRLGTRTESVVATTGDFALARPGMPGSLNATYAFVCAVDDGDDRITLVVRGDDLVNATARQRYLQRLLGLPVPEKYLHLPLLRGPDGERLAKRHGALTVAALRATGKRPAEVLGPLAGALGLVDDRRPRTLEEIRRALRPREAWFAEPLPLVSELFR